MILVIGFNNLSFQLALLMTACITDNTIYTCPVEDDEWINELVRHNDKEDNRPTEIGKLSNEEGRGIDQSPVGSFSISSQGVESSEISTFPHPQEATQYFVSKNAVNLNARIKSFYYQGKCSFINNSYIFFCLDEYYYMKSYYILFCYQ